MSVKVCFLRDDYQMPEGDSVLVALEVYNVRACGSNRAADPAGKVRYGIVAGDTERVSYTDAADSMYS